MREDDDVRRYLPLLRRIIILLAVIVAIPVVLWTITAFVRTYVSPPKIPTFHQLAATASTNAPPSTSAKDDAGSLPQAAASAAKPSAPLSVTAEARAAAADTRDAPKGPFLGERAPEGSAPVAAQLTPPVSAPLDGATANVAVAAQQPAATSEPLADVAAAMPAAAPLAGPIPLPRRRPHVTVAAETEPVTPAAETTRMASAGPIPIPRPRPEAAGPGAAAVDDSGNNPLGFIQNLFGTGSK